MTTTTLSILLLLIATASTLSDFDGKKDGAEPLLKRITPKGWMALIFLILTLVVSGGKEIYNYIDGKRKDAESALKAKQDQDSANARQSELRTQLKATQD
jgi:hypothetical protein